MLIVERWILARLRNQRFYSLAELNAAMGALDPEEAKLFVHWRDSDAVDYVMVPSRHNTIFDEASGGDGTEREASNPAVPLIEGKT